MTRHKWHQSMLQLIRYARMHLRTYKRQGEGEGEESTYVEGGRYERGGRGASVKMLCKYCANSCFICAV